MTKTQSSILKRLVFYSRQLKNGSSLYRNWRDARFLVQNGLFDPSWYSSTYPDVGIGKKAALHFVQYGWREGRDPSEVFSTKFYLDTYPDVKTANINPAIHFLKHGQHENRLAKMSPQQNTIRIDQAVAPRQALMSSAIESEFDKDFYLASFSDSERPADPIEHYLNIGWKEGRDPAPWFSTRHYLATHSDIAKAGINPFVHFCRTGVHEGRRLAHMGEPSAIYDAVSYATTAGPSFEEFDSTMSIGRQTRAKIITYYLPQFHSIPENDQHWGKGFTEWTNIARGMPQFPGHIQPKVPRDLGFYNLAESSSIMRRQIELAKSAGIFGFCFYYYWFDEKRVLETPLENMLADKSLDFPFCIMWANENWTRTWDGLEKDVILSQSYNSKNDESFMADWARHIKDDRYIKIDGKPVVFIYRPNQIPHAKETISRWRGILKRQHDVDVLIFMAQGFGSLDPREFGLDGAIEFPPHKLCQNIANRAASKKIFNPKYKGIVIDYDEVVERSVNEEPQGFPLIRTVIPQWDNEARRPGRGTVIDGSTPEKFESWLRYCIDYARANPVFGENIVAVNAWNEWAEGAYLEPDVHYGAAYLNSVARAVHGYAPKAAVGSMKVVITSHDAYNHGAQTLALKIGRTLRMKFGVDVAYIVAGDGPLIQNFRDIGHVEVVKRDSKDSIQTAVGRLAGQGYRIAIANTTLSGALVPSLKSKGFTIVSLIHELPRIIKNYKAEEYARSIAKISDHVVFPAKTVLDGFERIAPSIMGKVDILPQGLYRKDLLALEKRDNGVRSELGFSDNSKIVIGAGFADLRKGVDRFISTALIVCAKQNDVCFVWLGPIAGEIESWFMPEVEDAGLSDRIKFVGHVDDIGKYYAAGDLFFLSSREDPFPSVVLEAMALGLPVVGYSGCGGCDELIANHGILADPHDPLSAAKSIQKLLVTPEKKKMVSAARRREVVASNYGFDSYCFSLLQKLEPSLASVSVIVPSYNYENYIGERLRSIFNQTYPVLEIIALDDASTDRSVDEMRRVAEADQREIDIVVNPHNSGSPFRQWAKGVRAARGEYVWICEADDDADPEFLARLVAQMEAADSSVGFCDSRQVDHHGRVIGDSYRWYLNEIEDGAFDKAFDMSGDEFLKRFLAVKNIILNVSGVLFRKSALESAILALGADLETFQVAGDWRIYAQICAAGGGVSYNPRAMNAHRRHSSSVTGSLDIQRHLGEIRQMQDWCARASELNDETRKKQLAHLASCENHLSKSAV